MVTAKSLDLVQSENTIKESNIESLDFGYVDADKVNYPKYHERLLRLIKVGGIIVYDNTLRGGSVAMPEHSVPEGAKPARLYAIEFNTLLASDDRIQISHVPPG
ncbi:unnamed protein product [Cuscuta epithymum]|uniref:caffeoyl-CoA O-methyltransferase n=1 Tax=Cuscuta epithymum TaxID=186058 RepID=A0AAV0DIQ8_9ASTE|nr:unnamed protein product [Cuscuta epithymum]